MTIRQLTATVLATTIVIGLARSFQETTAARHGPRTSWGHATRRCPATDSWVRRIAAWVPPSPQTPTGRVVAAALAAPLTVMGGLLVRVGRGELRWDPHRGCWVATSVGGPSAVVLAAMDMAANTLGHVVIVPTATASDHLLDHEAVHVRQSERLGLALPLVYAWCTARYGYRSNPFEQAARRGAAVRKARP